MDIEVSRSSCVGGFKTSDTHFSCLVTALLREFVGGIATMLNLRSLRSTLCFISLISGISEAGERLLTEILEMVLFHFLVQAIFFH